MFNPAEARRTVSREDCGLGLSDPLCGLFLSSLLLCPATLLGRGDPGARLGAQDALATRSIDRKRSYRRYRMIPSQESPDSLQGADLLVNRGKDYRCIHPSNASCGPKYRPVLIVSVK